MENLTESEIMWAKYFLKIHFADVTSPDFVRLRETCLKALEQCGEQSEQFAGKGKTLARIMADRDGIAVPQCDFCTNPMKNLAGPVSGCDGNCQFEDGVPEDSEVKLRNDES